MITLLCRCVLMMPLNGNWIMFFTLLSLSPFGFLKMSCADGFFLSSVLSNASFKISQ